MEVCCQFDAYPGYSQSISTPGQWSAKSMFRIHQMTTISSCSLYHFLHVLSETLPSFYVSCCGIETCSVSPSPNGNHDRGCWWKLMTRFLHCREQRPRALPFFVENLGFHERQNDVSQIRYERSLRHNIMLACARWLEYGLCLV